MSAQRKLSQEELIKAIEGMSVLELCRIGEGVGEPVRRDGGGAGRHGGRRLRVAVQRLPRPKRRRRST